MDKDTETPIVDNDNFVCDICGCATKAQFEGAEPNTCEMCKPVEVDIDDEDCGYYHARSRHFDLDE